MKSVDSVKGDGMNWRRVRLACVGALAIALAVTVVADPGPGDVLGLASETGAGWFAVRVEIPADSALAGFRWFNNDDQVVYPDVRLATGHPAGPEAIDDALVVGELVVGEASAWSELTFEAPVAASLDALYVIFAFPAGSAYTAPGSGGGAAVGYVASPGGARGWLSGDGSHWIGLDAGHAFAVDPVLVPYEEGMLVKRLGGPAEGKPEDDLPAVPEPYFRAGPNPFNPVVTLRYGLVREGRVRIDVYDVRGRRVGRLIDAVLPAGHHEVAWRGLDAAGRAVASGVYFLRLRGPDRTFTRRVALVR